MSTSPPDLRQDPDALRVVKRPIPVQVEFASEDGSCETLEGPVAYRAGDALITGIAGERWPIARARFDADYTPTGSTQGGENGRYSKRHIVVLAKKLAQPMRVKIERGVLQGNKGDWLVQYAADDYGIVRADLFAASYVRDSERTRGFG